MSSFKQQFHILAIQRTFFESCHNALTLLKFCFVAVLKSFIAFVSGVDCWNMWRSKCRNVKSDDVSIRTIISSFYV